MAITAVPRRRAQHRGCRWSPSQAILGEMLCEQFVIVLEYKKNIYIDCTRINVYILFLTVLRRW